MIYSFIRSKLKHRFIGKEQIDALKYFYFLFVDGFQLKKV